MIGAALGGLALLLTLTGIYGVVSYFVTQRTKEIGIRVALGATTRIVTGLVLKQSLRLTAIGTVLGTGLAIGLSRLLASSMVFMRVFDGAAFSGPSCWLSPPHLLPDTSRPAGQLKSTQSRRFVTTEKCRFDRSRRRRTALNVSWR